METGVVTRSMRATIVEDETEQNLVVQSEEPMLSLAQQDMAPSELALASILKELRDFRKDNKEQYSDIKRELRRVNDRVKEAEDRIDETETVLQAASKLIVKLTERQASLEERLIDQEGRARRDNLRIYGILEDKEGSDMITFLDNLLKTALGFPADQPLGIQRAHRALTVKPNDKTKPRSIVVKFGSYQTKEDVIRRAWQKKTVLCDGVRFFVDHDYPIEVLKKRNEYREAKLILRERRIKFQTPYPSKLRVFYDNGTRIYKDASEATRDMAERGLNVTIVKPAATPDKEELQRLSAWHRAPTRHLARRTEGGGETLDHHSGEARGPLERQRTHYREKLQAFRRDNDD